MNNNLTYEQLIDVCEDFIVAANEYDKNGRPKDPEWVEFLPKMCTIHHAFGQWIRQNKEVPEYTLDIYTNAGECLAYELKHLNDWARVEAIYHHMVWMYKDYATEIDQERLMYYQEQEKEAQLNKHEKQSFGCFGCLGILIVVGILYKILF